MNFNFSDMSSQFASMLQQDIPRAVMSEKGRLSTEPSLFNEKLKKVQDHFSAFRETSTRADFSAASLSSTQNTPASSDMDAIISQLSESVDQKSGKELILLLQSVLFTLSSHDMDSVSLNTDAMAALKEILVKSGFDVKDIDQLLQDLMEDQPEGKISLKDLFDGLFELETENSPLAQDNTDSFLDLSALPYLVSLLNSLQVEPEKISHITTQIENSQEGVNLDILIDELKTLLEETFFQRTPYQTQPDDQQFSLFLKQLDIDIPNPSEGVSHMTLADLVTGLEKLKETRLSQQTVPVLPGSTAGDDSTDKSLHDLLKILFNSLEFSKKKDQVPVFQFSEKEMKSQLGLPELNTQFAKGISKSKIPPWLQSENFSKKSFQKIASLISEKNYQTSDMKSPVSDSRILAGKAEMPEIKTSDLPGIKTSDLPLSEISDIRAGETSSGKVAVKPAPIFKNLPDHVVWQVSKGVSRAVAQGENTLRIQLKPPELGRLMMTIDQSTSGIKVHILAENQGAREILTSNLNEIKTVLSNSGVNLERFEVDLGSSFRQSLADARQFSGQFNKGTGNRSHPHTDDLNNEGVGRTAESSDQVNQDGSLHYIA